GLYLYQAWTSFISEALEDASLGLRSIRLSRSEGLNRVQLRKIRDRDLQTLAGDLARMKTLSDAVEEAIGKVESTYESATNFHDTLDSLVSDETFDVGLYKPIMSANGKHLEGIGEKLSDFRTEFGRVSKRMASLAEDVKEEQTERAARPTSR